MCNIACWSQQEILLLGFLHLNVKFNLVVPVATFFVKCLWISNFPFCMHGGQKANILNLGQKYLIEMHEVTTIEREAK